MRAFHLGSIFSAVVASASLTLSSTTTPALGQTTPPRTTCGADPQVTSIKLRRMGLVGLPGHTAEIVAAVMNRGNRAQSGAVAGHQFLYLYALGVAGRSPRVPVAQVAVPPLAVNGVAFASARMRFPFTSGDVPSQFQARFQGDPDVGEQAGLFDCNTSNDVMTLTVDMPPFYLSGAH